MSNKGASSCRDSESNLQESINARPWLLPVPNFTRRKRGGAHTGRKRVEIDCSNDALLLLQSKVDPEWHSVRIPSERRKVLRLPILSWSSEEEGLDNTLAPEIEALIETEALVETESDPHTVPRLIPLELKKRKRNETLSTAGPDSTAPGPMRNGETQKFRRLDCPSQSFPPGSKLSPSKRESPVEIKTIAHESPMREVSNGAVHKASFTEPDSPPPMRILSVRSLADDFSYSYIYDPLDERIPVDLPNSSGDDQPPLYIFNPVKRVTVSVGGDEQNDSHAAEENKSPKETPSDTRHPINASNGLLESTDHPKPGERPSQESNLNVILDNTGTAIVSNPSHDGSLRRNGAEKVAQETEAIMGIGSSMPITQDTPPSDGKPSTSITEVLKKPRSPNGSERDTLIGIAEHAGSDDGDLALQNEERLIHTCTSDDVSFVIGFDPHSSPFEDSDGEDARPDGVRPTGDPIEPNFTSRVLKELDVNGGEPKEGEQSPAVLDHSYSKPHGGNDPSPPGRVSPAVPGDRSLSQSAVTTDDLSIRGPTRLVVRLPKTPNTNRADDFTNGDLPSKRQRKSSSSSSTDTSVGVSSTAIQLDTTILRVQRQDELITKHKVMKSKIILREMQRIAEKERSHHPVDSIAHEKEVFLRELANYFRKNDFSKEPLNRSILNAMAEWLSPLANGKLPPSSLRNMLIDLIKEFTLTTPAQVFQTSSIEGVLILLMNHPKESSRNKKLEWSILNSWRDD